MYTTSSFHYNTLYEDDVKTLHRVKLKARKGTTPIDTSRQTRNRFLPSFKKGDELPSFKNEDELPSLKNNDKPPSFKIEEELPSLTLQMNYHEVEINFKTKHYFYFKYITTVLHS